MPILLFVNCERTSLITFCETRSIPPFVGVKLSQTSQIQLGEQHVHEHIDSRLGYQAGSFIDETLTVLSKLIVPTCKGLDTVTNMRKSILTRAHQNKDPSVL